MNETPHQRTAVLILGMHRSGTSALTRVVNAMGADLPGDLMEATENNNKKGFWESKKIALLNDELLARMGCYWDKPWSSGDSPISPSDSRHFSASIVKLLDKYFQSSRLFVIKDPRISLLAPFWMKVLEQFDTDSRILIVVRNPLEVAASIGKRDGFGLSQSLLLWLKYCLAAESTTRGNQRLVVTFESVLLDWEQVVVSAERRLGVVWPKDLSEAREDLKEFLDPQERHHVASDNELAEDDTIVSWVREVYSALVNLSRTPDDLSQIERLDRVAREMVAAEATYGQILEYLGSELKQASERVQTLSSTSEATADAALQRMAREKRKNAQLSQKLALLAKEFATQKEDLARAEAVAAGLGKELEAQAKLGQKQIADLRAIQETELGSLRAEQQRLREIIHDRSRASATEISALQEQISIHANSADGFRLALERKDEEMRRLQIAIRSVARDARGGMEKAAYRLASRASLFALTPLALVSRNIRSRLSANKMVTLIAASKLFDSDYYVNQNPEVLWLRMPPVEHYVLHGFREGRDPHPLFWSAWYLQSYTDVAASDVNPLYHYLAFGADEGRDPCPLFQTQWYVENYPDAVTEGLSGIEDYLVNGAAAGRNPNPLFAGNWYLQKYPDVAAAKLNPLVHFVMFGSAEGRSPHPLFDTAWYLERYPEVAKSGANPLAHYLGEGKRRAYNPNPLFDVKYYLAANPDVAAGNVHPLVHYALFGKSEGRLGRDTKRTYQDWLAIYEAADEVTPRGRRVAKEKTALFSILLHGDPGDPAVVKTIESVVSQTMANWEMFIAVDGETEPLVRLDKRIHLIANAANCSAEGCLNNALKAVRGDYVARLLSGDTLSASALSLIADTLRANPVAMLYCDEDQVSSSGVREKPVFKPKWNPELMLSHDYVGAGVFYSMDVIGSVGGYREGMGLAADFDLCLRVTESLDETAICRLPRILLHRGSTVCGDPAASEKAVLNAVIRRGWAATVGISPLDADRIRVQYELPDPAPKVSVIIPTRNGLDMLRVCIDSLVNKTIYADYEIIIVDNGSDDADTLQYLQSLKEVCGGIDHTVLRDDLEFNFSRLNNLGVEHAVGAVVVLMNNDIEIIESGWLAEMVGQAIQPDAGAVGAMLLYPDRTIQHAGTIVGMGGVAGHAYVGLAEGAEGYCGRAKVSHNMTAVTAACLAVRRDVYLAAGGMDEINLSVDFNDVDLCLRVGQVGLRNVWTPFARLVHHESRSRESHTTSELQRKRFAKEIAWMQTRWFDRLLDDPAYNPNLSLDPPGFQLAWPPRRCDPRAGPGSGRQAPRGVDKYISATNVERVGEVVAGCPRRVHVGSDGGRRASGLSVIILNLDKPEFLNPLVAALLKAAGEFEKRELGFEILIGDTGSTDPSVLKLYQESDRNIRVLRHLEYQFSRCNNTVYHQKARYDTVLFLNNDISFDDATESLLAMYKHLASSPEIGIVGARLLFPTGSVQHSGIDVFRDGELRGFVYHPGAGKEPLDSDTFPRQALAVTGACLMVKAEVFELSGGFDEGYRTECQDAALCLSARRLGYEIEILSPGRIIHFENGTRPKGSEDWGDRQRLMRHWSSWIEAEVLM